MLFGQGEARQKHLGNEKGMWRNAEEKGKEIKKHTS